MNKLIYIGQAVLDLSKILMYQFHYDYALPKWGSNHKLNYIDTATFIRQIFTYDFYVDIEPDIDEWFDTSNYSPAILRPLPVGRNKKVVRKMKDEMGGRIITDFTALRSKSLTKCMIALKARNARDLSSM